MPDDAVTPGGTAVVVWSRDVDLRTVQAIRDEIDAALTPGLTRLIIELTNVGFVDSLGLGVLIHARNQCLAIGATLVLRGMPDRTRGLIDASGLAGLFEYEG